MHPISPFRAVIIALVTLPYAHAATIWTDTFSDARTAPNPYDYAGGAAGDDYTISLGTSNTTTVGSGFLKIVDGNSNQTLVQAYGNQYAQSSFAAGTKITVSYDFRVNSLNAAANASAPRLSIMSATAVTGSEVLTVGYTYANFTGQPTSTLGFYYVGGAGSTPAVGNGIGMGATGFNFGTYSSTTATSNDTNGFFYRFSLSMTQGSSAVTGLVTRLDALGNATADTATFTTNLTSALNWTGSATDGIRISTGVGGFADFDIDNIVVDATIPEPAAAALGSLGVLLIAGRRKR